MANPVVFGRAKWLNANTNLHGGWDLRPSVYGVPPGPGVAGYDDFRVIQRQAGANMTVDVGTTAATAVGMAAWVRGTTRGHQGLYECVTVDWGAPTTDTYVAQLNVDVGANASGNPRLDQVVLEVLDSQHTGSSAVMQIRVVAGTATGGATLDNRTGAAALPASCILLADILVPNGAASILTADIRNRRQFPLAGAVPPHTSALDAVMLGPPLVLPPQQLVYEHNLHDTMQSALAVYLPRRIVAATRLRWKYHHGATANTGNYNFGVYDASGRQIVTTGVVAFTGAALSYQLRAETIAATTFEAGWYYVLCGWDSATAGGQTYYTGVSLALAATLAGPQLPNVGYRSATGGTTLPTTFATFSDVAALAADTTVPPVPLFGLSVG